MKLFFLAQPKKAWYYIPAKEVLHSCAFWLAVVGVSIAADMY